MNGFYKNIFIPACFFKFFLIQYFMLSSRFECVPDTQN